MLLPLQAAPQAKIEMPDFTKGDAIPEGANHTWNLGATGARGWMFTDRLVTSDARQVKVTDVMEGSPAEGKLEVGDVILGVGGKAFSYDPRTEIGKALTAAEASDGKLIFSCWREGQTSDVTLDLPVLGTYSATAPYDCPKSALILKQGCEALAESIQAEGYKQNPIARSLNALGLLASGEEKYLPLIKREAQWAADFKVSSMATWYYGYITIFLGEYIIATGDDSVLPGLRRIAMEAAVGQSAVGSWGHGFAGPDGRLLGYGMMNSPGVPLTIGLVLAREAGVKDPEVAEAIERSVTLLRFYIGKGALPYGDHKPWTETHEDNGKCGMAAVLFNLLGEDEGAEFFSRMSLASHGPERDCGHTGNYFNLTWAMPAVAKSGPQATGAWMKEFGNWYFDLARKFDGMFVHLGPAQARNDSYASWDATGLYMLAYALPLKKIYLTGKKPPTTSQLSAEEAQQLILDGRGWNNKQRNEGYDSLDSDSLLERLGSWSPTVRERAASALARRGGVPTETLVELLNSSSLYARLGACEALKALRGKAASAVPALREAFKADDLWLRVKAAEALAVIGPAAMVALPEMLERIAEGPSKSDPRGMEQRFLCFAVFGTMLRNSLDGVNPQQLEKAILSGLKNQDGRARGSVGSLFRQFSYEQIEPLLPAIYDAIVKPAPSGIMFAHEVRMNGLQVLSKNRIKEGMRLIPIYAQNQKPHGSEKRVAQIVAMLKPYGTHAKSVIPDLEAVAVHFDGGEPNFPKRLSADKAKDVRAGIEEIKATTETPKLKQLKR
ncbi:MAG: DUF6288 domain-containing protein [Akkermansiaceae bacterium]